MERLDKLIAGQGTLSRREARELVRSGQVRVGGATVFSPERKVGEGEEIIVAGKPLQVKRHLYLMLNKPAEVLCATRDRDARTVLDLVPLPLRRKGLFPAGRLDKDAEGLVLLTDDGALAHRILAPKSHIPKTYFVRLDRPVQDGALLAAEFARGVGLGDGARTSPAELRLSEDGREAELVIFEGMYHQVKRMFAHYRYSVEYLKRIKIGGLCLDPSLAPGQCRELTAEEVRRLPGEALRG